MPESDEAGPAWLAFLRPPHHRMRSGRGTAGRVTRVRRELLSRWLAVTAVLGLATAALLGGAEPAFAHANLLFSTPSANATVAVMPKSVSLVFDQQVTETASPVTLAGPRGAVTTVGATLSHDGSTVDVAVPSGQGPGIYTVSWQITARDGDVMSGSYQFAVGPKSASLTGASTVTTKAVGETAALRGLLLVALALSLGEYAGRWLFRRIPNRPKSPRAWFPWATAGGAIASAGLVILQLGDGTLILGLTQPSFSALLSRPGIAASVALLGFTFAAVSTRFFRRWAWLPLTAVVIAEALRAHPGNANPLLGIPLTVLHLGGAMLWAGTLFYVLRTAVAWRQQGRAARAAITAYSRPAVWIFVVIAVTGLVNALILVPLDQVASTDYGRVLLIKVLLVVAAATLAWIARRRLIRQTADRVIGPARLEASSLVGVLALSVVLTMIPPPADPTAPLPFAPPPNGLSVPVAALDASVNVTANASAGQLVVQLTAPHSADEAGSTIIPVVPGAPRDAGNSSASLTGALTSPDGKTRQLTFRSCGSGCFFTPAHWADGISHLTLSPSVGSWPTVDTGLTVEWPPKPGDDLLARTIAAMKAVPEFTLYERVTARSGQPGIPMTLHLTGSDFVRRALFASGKVPAVVRLRDLDGNSRLVISYPAEGAVEELIIGPDERILKHTLTSSDLVTDTFIYPEAGGG